MGATRLASGKYAAFDFANAPLIAVDISNIRLTLCCWLLCNYYFYITKFKYHLCYYLILFAILAKGTVR